MIIGYNILKGIILKVNVKGGSEFEPTYYDITNRNSS